MSKTDYADGFRTYWADRYDSAHRLRLELAAKRPLSRWLVADVGLLVDEEYGVELGHLARRPDDVLEAAREGFERFVVESELESTADSYAFLPIHFVGIPPAQRTRLFSLEDHLTSVDSLTVLTAVPVSAVSGPTIRPVTVTYRCPLGHETTVDQPLHGVHTLERCGDLECGNEVHVDDSRTQYRRVVEFTARHDGRDLRCVTTGRYASDETTVPTDRAYLNGILRLVTTADGAVEPVYEVLHCGRA